MTRYEIIEMACQAFGGIIKKEEREKFIVFAKLVAEFEREACALIFDDANGTGRIASNRQAAEAIRARGQA
jgi:hypothetical protein